ncbi:unnamed protein product [Cuscuta campestris]|uniref:DUF4283 domain-containing protein n=1 Tax=Cuscuta campestris TaxID=132261 RepID=A0A484LRK2_9ASTE|nr:unnamed protein product [Cuscuta campestris]
MGKRGLPSKTIGKASDNPSSDEIQQSPSTSKASNSKEREVENQIDSEKNEDLKDQLASVITKPDPNKKKTFAEVVGIQEDLNLNLSFIAAEELDGKQIIRLSMDDVIEPGKYWNSALVCCILGANPPLDIIKGFLSKIWKTYDIEDISFLKESQFIVRFAKEEDRDEILKCTYYFMDNKPVYVQKWYPGCKVDVMSRKDIPVWVQFSEPEMKYWSLTGLRKLGSAIGKPVKRDKARASRRKWSYARILIEVQVNQTFPDQIHFLNEEGRIISQSVKKKNPPTDAPKKPKYIWRPKDTKNEEKVAEAIKPTPVQVHTDPQNSKESVSNEEEGFIQVSKKKAARRFSLDSSDINLEGIHADLRIWVVWDHNKVCIRVIEETDQFIHCKGRFVGDDHEFFVSFVYAQNEANRRKELWDTLLRISTNEAWCVLGDFNTVLNLDERIGGNITNWEETRVFRECLNCNTPIRITRNYTN